MSRLNFLLFQLSFFVPLLALLLLPFGLVVLTGRSRLRPWLARLAAPPFYLVSLPIATLIVGAEMLGWYSLFVIGELSSPHRFSWDFRFAPFFLNPIPGFLFVPFSSVDLWAASVGPGIIASFIGFWAAVLMSGYLLSKVVRREDHRQPSSPILSRLPRGLLLLTSFAWAFFYLVTYVGFVTAPWGPWS